MRRCRLKTFYFKLWWPFCSVEQNHVRTFGKGSKRNISVKLFGYLAAILFRRAKQFLQFFGRGLPKEHFCEIILKSVHWCRRRSHLKVSSIFSSGGDFVQ